jgi:integrase
MPRPLRKQKLSELLVKRLRPAAEPYLVWDTYQRGLALRVQPTGVRAWNCIYRHHGRPRWLHLGNANAIGLAAARELAGAAMVQVAKGHDPAAEKRALRSKGTFEELAQRYVEDYAKRENKSWAQADALVRRNLLPRWGKLHAVAITRGDVKAMMARITAPIVANQTLAAASAIFSWAIKEELVTSNPCRGVDRNQTTDRDRVMSASEIPKFWTAFDTAGLVAGTALKIVLLTGQRPGEVAHMRREHIVDGWWELPGAAVPTLGWPGTKNGAAHRVWLPAPAQELLAELSDDDARKGFVFATERGGPCRDLGSTMRAICSDLKVERATPHDLRRTHGTTIAALDFGRDAMNRIQNHKEGGIGSVYDRHQYSQENKHVMETVAAHIMALVTGAQPVAGNVVRGKFNK